MFPSNLTGEDTGNFIVIGRNIHITAHPVCPRCQGPGSFALKDMPVEESVSEIVQKTDTVVDLLDLARAINEAIKAKASHEEAAQLIKEEAPKYTGITRLMPRGRSEVLAYLGLILGLLQVVVTVHPNAPDIHPGIAISSIFHHVY